MGLEKTEGSGDDHFALTTNRLRLRRPDIADAPVLASLANDWEVASKLSTMPHPYGLEEAKAFISRVRPVEKPAIVLFIASRDDDRLMGCCSLRIRACDGEFEIGYWLGRKYWSRGFATEAVHALVDLAFTENGLERLFVSCRVTNAASRRVIHKSGFQPDGTDMIASTALGGSVPVEVYSLDRSTWRALREWRREDRNVIS